jgi:hypothetical protein
VPSIPPRPTAKPAVTVAVASAAHTHRLRNHRVIRLPPNVFSAPKGAREFSTGIGYIGWWGYYDSHSLAGRRGFYGERWAVEIPVSKLRNLTKAVDAGLIDCSPLVGGAGKLALTRAGPIVIRP